MTFGIHKTVDRNPCLNMPLTTIDLTLQLHDVTHVTYNYCTAIRLSNRPGQPVVSWPVELRRCSSQHTRTVSAPKTPP